MSEMGYRHPDIESMVREMLHERAETLQTSRLAPMRILRRTLLRWLALVFVVTSVAALAVAGSVYAARSLTEDRAAPPSGPNLEPPDCAEPEEAEGGVEFTSGIVLLAYGEHRGEVWSVCGATLRIPDDPAEGLCLDVRVTGARGSGMSCDVDAVHRDTFKPARWNDVGLAWGIAPEATAAVRIRTRHIAWVEAEVVDLAPSLGVPVKLYVGATDPNDFARLEVLDADGNVIVTDDPPDSGAPTPEPPDEPNTDPIGPVEELASGTFAGRPWTVTVFNSESGPCLDYDGVDERRPMARMCTATEPFEPLADGHIGALVSWTDDSDARIIIGTLLKEVATLTIELDDGTTIPVEILEATQVDTPWNYYAVELPPGAKGRRVTRGASGAILETEPLVGNENR